MNREVRGFQQPFITRNLIKILQIKCFGKVCFPPLIDRGDYDACSSFKLKVIIVIARNMIVELPDRLGFEGDFCKGVS